ncbi:MAG: hypothetical protein IKO19_11410 [Candidatus Riflebacteria bacterium]|nr:hypothetical protein [Candidatus Riflebacteria bacterium]
MKKIWLVLLILVFISGVSFADNSDYQTLRTFMSAQMYGEAYNELMQRELSGLILDSKLRSLKIDLLERTNLKLQKQAKVSPDDPAIFTILADIAFQKGDYDRASMYISTAISNNGKAMSNYVFAKILFRKGNISQAFDQMSKVLEAMPESPVVFNDFQFLYNCKQYGVATAKKITKDCNFLVRSTPIAYDNDEVEVPVSPFENDPTVSEDGVDFSNYKMQSDTEEEDYSDTGDVNVDDDLAELSKIDIASVPKEDTEKPIKESEIKEEKTQTDAKLEKKESKSSKESSDFDFDDDELDFDEPEQKEVLKPKKEEEKEIKDEKDPEEERIKKADELLASAKAKFKEGDIDTALSNLEELEKVYPKYPGKADLEDKVKYEKHVKDVYRQGVDLHNAEDYEKALKLLKEAYNYKPAMFPEAPFYIGRCYLLKKDPDYDQVLKYFEIVMPDNKVGSEIKRDILWTKLEILYEQEKYTEAKEIFDYFVDKENEFLVNQPDYKRFRYGLWLHLYLIWIILVAVLVLGIAIFVFVLQFLPDLALIGGDPLTNAQKALAAGKFTKAIKYAEKALLKKQPIQRDRQLREVLVQAYFAIKNYEKCQLHAKNILKEFPENTIAWGHLAKASIELEDTSNEAIRTYEELYRSDPSRRELLPLLAHHYVKTKDLSPASMEILQDYLRDKPDDVEIITALADGYVNNRTMNEDIIPTLNDAIKLKDKLEYRELLARTFSKCGMYEEAARECVNVLKRSINNVGIHVVYTSSMKKLKQVPKAIAQYKEFIQNNPGNNQLVEILNGLKKEEGDASTAVDDVTSKSVSIFDSLGMPGMDEEPQETALPSLDQTPVPDFMAESSVRKEEPSAANTVATKIDGVGNVELPDNIQTMNPFADGEEDPLFDGFDTEELPEELGGTARAPVETSKSLDSLIDNFNNTDGKTYNESLASIRNMAPSGAPQTGTLELAEKIDKAKDLSVTRQWDRVIELLSPEFASARNKDAGMLLVNAWLGNNKPEMALEIIQTLDFDPEMMSDEVKDVMYRTALALENNKNYSQALKLYDEICNADINFRDAFDRSDKLYVKMKG